MYCFLPSNRHFVTFEKTSNFFPNSFPNFFPNSFPFSAFPEPCQNLVSVFIVIFCFFPVFSSFFVFFPLFFQFFPLFFLVFRWKMMHLISYCFPFLAKNSPWIPYCFPFLAENSPRISYRFPLLAKNSPRIASFSKKLVLPTPTWQYLYKTTAGENDGEGDKTTDGSLLA